MFTVYGLLYLAALSLLFPSEFLKRPKQLRKKWLREKLGFMDSIQAAQTIWLHAVSVGEVNASVPFVRALKGRYPSLGFVVSTITDTGQKVASERLSDIAKVVYLPFDTGFALRRAVERIKPVVFISVETEIWPNTFRLMNEAGVPVAIVNGRISDGSYKGYGRIRFFLKRVFKNVNLFCMQDWLYAERAIALGASENRVKVTGNFKFDINASSGGRPGWADSIEGQVIIAGSTHRGEEELILGAYLRLKEENPSLNLILAPRHPERFDEVEQLVVSRKIPVIRRSRIAEYRKVKGSAILLDVMGELFSAYSFADIAIVGGSFIERGGQNPLEPAYWEKPVVCGPHMENFPFIEEFFKEGGAVRTSGDELYETLRGLMENPGRRTALGMKAKELCEKNAGAVERTITALGERLIKGYGNI